MMLALALCWGGAWPGSADSDAARERLARWRARRASGADGAAAAPAGPPAACSQRGGGGRQAVLFWVEPRALEGDAADASDPGYFSEWGPDFFAPEVEFRSEEVVLRVSFCLPPASPLRPDDCSVAMQYAGLDRCDSIKRACVCCVCVGGGGVTHARATARQSVCATGTA